MDVKREDLFRRIAVLGVIAFLFVGMLTACFGKNQQEDPEVVDPDPIPLPTEDTITTEPEEPEVIYGIVTASKLNVRASADASADIVTKLARSTKVEILGESGTWYEVRAGEYTGFAAMEYISTDLVGEDGNENVKTGTVTAKSLIVRAQPSSDGTQVGGLMKGTVVTILEDKGEWLRVSYDDISGYVSAQYVAVSE